VSPPEDFTAAETEGGAYHTGRERSLGLLFAELAEDLRRLVRLEIALFQREIGEKAGRLGRGVGALAAGAAIAFSGWLALLAAATLALSIVLPAWLAAVIVGAIVLLIGAVLMLLGKRWLDAARLVPARTLNTLREDGAWIKDRLS
jgi:hypothetical protein